MQIAHVIRGLTGPHNCVNLRTDLLQRNGRDRNGYSRVALKQNRGDLPVWIGFESSQT